MADFEKSNSREEVHIDRKEPVQSQDFDDIDSIIKNSNIARWSASSIRLYISVFCACCCAFANGYDGSLMTALQDMPYWQNHFNVHTKSGATVSVIFSMYTVGSMIGAPFAATVSDKFGRRKGMFIGSWIIILGMIIAVTGNKIAQFIVARFILGFGIAILTVAAPAYSMEIAPPQWRGRATGLYNCGWFGGSIPAAAVTFGTSYMNNHMSWRLPLIFQAVACMLVLVLVFFVPESPRFLMAQGDEEGAHAFLTKYHGNGDPNAPLVLFQLKEMRESIAFDSIDKVWWDYRPLFLTRGGRWRMAQVLMISIFGQFSGNGLGYFTTVIYENLGVDTVAKRLGYNLVNQVVSAACAVTAATLTDRIPRRAILPLGTFLCAVMLGINSGLSAVLDTQQTKTKAAWNVENTNFVNKNVAQSALAFFFLFNCVYSFTYTPLQGVIPVEALTTNMRAKGLAASGFIVSAVGFINQFAGPIGLENLGYKYIYVFVGWDCVEALLWWFFCVESQGRTLEELDWIYSQSNPVKASKQYKRIVATEGGFVAQ